LAAAISASSGAAEALLLTPAAVTPATADIESMRANAVRFIVFPHPLPKLLRLENF
jgi:hypothetical protein